MASNRGKPATEIDHSLVVRPRGKTKDSALIADLSERETPRGAPWPTTRSTGYPYDSGGSDDSGHMTRRPATDMARADEINGDGPIHHRDDVVSDGQGAAGFGPTDTLDGPNLKRWFPATLTGPTFSVHADPDRPPEPVDCSDIPQDNRDIRRRGARPCPADSTGSMAGTPEAFHLHRRHAVMSPPDQSTIGRSASRSLGSSPPISKRNGGYSSVIRPA